MTDTIKQYLTEKNIDSLDKLAKHIEQLKVNTFPDKLLIGELISVLEEDQLSLVSFFAENFKEPKIKTSLRESYEKVEKLKNFLLSGNSGLKTSTEDIFQILEADTEEQLTEILVRLKMEEGGDVPQARISPMFLDEILEQSQTMQDSKQEDVSHNHIEKENPEDVVGTWQWKVKHFHILNLDESKKPISELNGTSKLFEKAQEKYGESSFENYIGKKESAGKTDYSEINWNFIDAMAKRMNANKHKYPHGNSQKHIDIDDLLQATQRHLRRMLQPIPGDIETFEEHGAAVGCNMAMIFTQLENGQKLSLDLDVKM